MGDLDRCHGPIRSFSGRLIGPVALSSDVLSCHLLWGGLSSRVPCSAPCPSADSGALVLRNVAKTDPDSALGLAKVILGPPCATSGCHSQDSDTCSLYPVLRAMSQGSWFAALIQYCMDPSEIGGTAVGVTGHFPERMASDRRKWAAGNGTQTLNGEDTPPNNTMTLSPGDSGLWGPRNPAWQLLGVHFSFLSSHLGKEDWSRGGRCLADATSCLPAPV